MFLWVCFLFRRLVGFCLRGDYSEFLNMDYVDFDWLAEISSYSSESDSSVACSYVLKDSVISTSKRVQNRASCSTCVSNVRVLVDVRCLRDLVDDIAFSCTIF